MTVPSGRIQLRHAYADDEAYPRNLRAARRRPAALWWRGELRPADARAVAIGGARDASEAGRAHARRLAGELAGHGVTVVSGLARGIDAEAHAAALAAGGRTLAVLAHGLDQPVAPRSNAGLAVAIEHAGALVSRYPPGTPPAPYRFRVRNPTIAGLALATVIIEGTAGSGTHALALAAHLLGRPVLLARSLLDAERWARDFAARAGVYALATADDVLARIAEPPGRRLGSDHEQLSF